MSPDIAHYPSRCIIRFMPSYGRLQYSRVLYHDYERSGHWDAVCISLRQNEMDQYTRGGWIRGLHVQKCVRRDRQPWEIRVHNCSWLQAVSLFLCLFLKHTAVFRCMHWHCVLIQATFWYKHTVYQPVTASFFPLVLVTNFMKPYFFGDAAGKQAGRQTVGRSRSLACSHLSADLQAVCHRSLGAFSGCILPSWEEAALWIHLFCHPKCSKQAAWLSLLWNWKIWAFQ